MDELAARGVRCVTVLDIALPALMRAQSRMGPSSRAVKWVHADITDPLLALEPVDIWHDRAVFHFLTDPDDRRRYVERLRATLKPGGQAVFATFALDGPQKCSGLSVVRYSSETLGAELGADFEPAGSRREDHETPSGGVQAFQWSRFILR